MDPFIGEIRVFGFNYAPQDWAYCNGQTLPLSQFQALASLIGVTYGGDGKTTIGLPNLMARTPVGFDSRTQPKPGTATGTESVTLSLSQLPTHNHTMAGEIIATQANFVATPSATALPNLVANGKVTQKAFSTSSTPNTYLSPSAIAPVGGGGTHENRQPFLAINFCICTNGVYPDLQD